LIDNIVEDLEFSKLMERNLQDIMIHFFQKEQNFGILCKIDEVSFSPELPEEIAKSFNSLTLFFLAGYTFETAKIEDDFLIFEAGFGAENIGSVLSVPLLSIMQVIVDETPVMINLSSYKPQKKVIAKKVDDNGVKNSMNSFLSNPENSKFLK